MSPKIFTFEVMRQEKTITWSLLRFHIFLFVLTGWISITMMISEKSMSKAPIYHQSQQFISESWVSNSLYKKGFGGILRDHGRSAQLGTLCYYDLRLSATIHMFPHLVLITFSLRLKHDPICGDASSCWCGDCDICRRAKRGEYASDLGWRCLGPSSMSRMRKKEKKQKRKINKTKER